MDFITNIGISVLPFLITGLVKLRDKLVDNRRERDLIDYRKEQLRGDHYRALWYLRKYIEMHPKDATARFYEYQTLMQLDRKTEALSGLEVAIEMKIKNAKVHIAMGDHLRSMNQFEDALNAYKKVNNKKKYAEMHYKKALAYKGLGAYERAIKELKRATKHLSSKETDLEALIFVEKERLAHVAENELRTTG